MDNFADFSGRVVGQDGEVRARPLTPDRPTFWMVAPGVLYAEMAFSRAIRPPLLSDWESERVLQFSNRDRRARWLAGRALAKAVVREQLDIGGVVEIREGSDGEPLLYQDGFPASDVWLSIACRHGRVVAVVSNRAVGVDIRRSHVGEASVVERFIGRNDQRNIRRVIGSVSDSRSVGWAIKEAALRAARSSNLSGPAELSGVGIAPDLSVELRYGRLPTLAVRLHDHVAVAVVGAVDRPDQHVTKVVLDRESGKQEQQSALQGAIDRSLTRARRVAEARLRWQRLRWQT